MRTNISVYIALREKGFGARDSGLRAVTLRPHPNACHAAITTIIFTTEDTEGTEIDFQASALATQNSQLC
jgi:hypothetical protein